MAKYGLIGKLVASKGNGEELADIMLKASKQMKSREDCEEYSVSIDQNHPEIIWIYEIWDTKNAHDRSLEDQHVRELIVNAIPLLAESPQQGIETQVISS